MEENRKKAVSRFEMIDIIRGIACIVIVLYHYYGVSGRVFGFENNVLIRKIIENGNYAVDLFFILSGFCLCANYRDRLIERTVSYKNFLVRHYLKFVSYMILTMPLALVKQWLMFKNGWDVKPTLSGFVFDVLCIRTGYGILQDFPYNSALWFICVLGLMYLIYTVVCAVSYKSKTVYFMFSAGMLLFGWSLLGHPISFFVFQEITGRGCCNFFAGVLLYEFYELYREKEKFAVYAAGITIFGGVCLFVGGQHEMCGDSRIAADILFFVPLVLTTAFMPQLHNQFIRIFVKLAGFSTSIYIWHHPIIYFFSGLAGLKILPIEMSRAGVFAVVITVIMITAFVSKRLLEKAVYQKLLATFMPER